MSVVSSLAGALGGAAAAFLLFGLDAGAAAETRCGRRVGSMRVVKVAPDGSCLYHAVARGLLRFPRTAQRATRKLGWVRGASDFAPAGNLRDVLCAYIQKEIQRGNREELLRVLRGESEPTDTIEDLLARVQRQCSAESTTCGWAQYGEIALLARMLRVCISVFSVFGPGKHSYETPLGPTGRIETPGARTRMFRGGCADGEENARIMVVNRDMVHFDALFPCEDS